MSAGRGSSSRNKSHLCHSAHWFGDCPQPLYGLGRGYWVLLLTSHPYPTPSMIQDLDITVMVFHHFGKDFPKSEKLSPDAFIQMALQLAYYRYTPPPGRMKPGGRWKDLPGVSSAPFSPRIYGQACATYESASLRMFHLGRTDTIRSASVASLTFVKAMDDPNVTVRGQGQGWESWVQAFLPSFSFCQCTLSTYYIPGLW